LLFIAHPLKNLHLDSSLVKNSSTPVAAASLGQVYKAKLRSTGDDVAVKVQRPGVLKQIALDMHLIRQAAPLLKRTFNLNTDIVDVVDKWGVGFVDELDYQQEGRNAVEFIDSIQKTPLAGVVLAPEFLEEYSSGKMLVTKWVDGERLDKCTKSDVTALCSIAMNTYLTMMLETGVLHAGKPCCSFLDSSLSSMSDPHSFEPH
jgi:predicted unusual protein kinase regulating ubiquinone biosynthesis (AarF/ABC1/UbiB family)